MPRPALALLMLLTACSIRQMPGRVGPYHGLVPATFAPTPSPDRLVSARMVDQTVAVVTSQNFEAYTKAWRVSWGKDAAIEGSSASGKRISGAGVASDPRRLTDLVAEELQARFRETRATPDLATALEAGADYVAIVDMYFRWVSMGSQLSLDATVILIDRELREVMTTGHEVRVGRGGSDVQAFDTAMGQLTNLLQASLGARLGPRLK